nr:MAG: putative RNA dependent RNA polymerase [Xinjiang mito-like virus 49]
MKAIKTNLVNTSFFSNLKLYKTVYEAGSMISLSNEKHLKLVIKNIGWRILRIIFQNTKETNRVRMLHNFAIFILKFNKNHGEIMTTKYLKACQLAIQKKIAGQPFSSLREIEPNLPLPRLSKSGLPVCIKLSDRASICRGSLTVIRLWLTLFSIYRVFKTDFKPKINTITDPFDGDRKKLDDFCIFLDYYSKKVLANFPITFDITKIGAERWTPIWKSSPSSKVSWKGLVTSYLSLRDYPKVWDSFNNYIQLTNAEFLKTILSNLEWSCDHLPSLKKMIKDGYGFQTSVGAKGPIGRLAFKEEAAGKLRVFAMAEVLTQSLMKPLHLKLFDLFKLLPNDGTHDQERAFNYAQSLAQKHGKSFGFDLSSATDRLPVDCQARILTSLFGSNFGEVWKSILVDRPYVVGPNSYKIEEGDYYYKVGQPMGALSSWAMLNLMHHMMLQYCYKMEYPTFQGWYDQYVVLGDDIVIFEDIIAQRYLQLCKDLGVTINESKSIISKLPVVEFAKRTSYYGFDVSAFSFKEFISSDNFFGRLGIATKLVRRKIGKSLQKTFLFSQALKHSKKNSYLHSIIGFLTQKVMNKEGLSWIQLISLFNFYENPWSYFGKKLDSVNRKVLLKTFKTVLNGEKVDLDTDSIEFEKNNRFSLIAEDNYKVALLLQCKRFYDICHSDEKYLIKKLKPAWKKILPYTGEEKDPQWLYQLESHEARYYAYMLSWFLPKWAEIKVLDFTKIPPIPSSIFENMALVKNISISKCSEWEQFFNMMEHMKWVDFIETSKFKKLTFDQLLDLRLELESAWTDLNFFDDPKDLRKKLIDNPLKILDFISETVRDSNVKEKALAIKSLWLKGKEVPKEVPKTEQKAFIKHGLDKFLKPGFFKPGPRD